MLESDEPHEVGDAFCVRTGYIRRRESFNDRRATMGAQEERAVPGHVTPSRGPLTGIRVIELADEQAEYCGLTLAGLRADVVKVQPPRGQPTRRLRPLFHDP